MNIKNLILNIDKERDEEIFESLVDLYTLISLTLIFTVIVFGISNNVVNNTFDLPVQDVIANPGTTNATLDKVILIMITSTNEKTSATFIESGTKKRVFPISYKNIDQVFETELASLTRATYITFITDRNRTSSDSDIILSSIDWIHKHGMGSKLGLGFLN